MPATLERPKTKADKPPITPKPNLIALREELDETRLQVFRPNWRTLVAEAVLVRLTTKFWRAGERLDWAELGLSAAGEDFAAFATSYLKTGRHLLCPPEMLDELRAVTENARMQCKAYSLAKSPWGGWMIPKAAYKTWREQIEISRTRFESYRDNMLDTYEEWIGETVEAYRPLIETRLTVNEALAGGLTAEERAAQVDDLLEQVRRSIPTRDEIAKKFEFSYHPSYIEASAVLARGVDVAELEDRKAAAEARLEELDNELATAEAVHREQIEAERGRQRAVAAEMSERLSIERAIWEGAEKAAAQAQAQHVESVLSEVSATLRGLVYDAAELSLKALHKPDGKLKKPQIDALENLITNARLMNVGKDPQVETIIASIAERLPDLRAKERPEASLAAIRELLEDAQITVKSEMQTLGRAPRYGWAANIEPDEIRERQARGRFVREVEPEPMQSAPVERAVIEDDHEDLAALMPRVGRGAREL